jgi:hypothetical protein
MNAAACFALALLVQGCASTLAVRGSGHCDPPTRALTRFEPDPAPPSSASRVERLAAPVVWAYLSRREFSNEQRASIRDKIVERWHRYQGLEQEPDDTSALFGAGGRYDADLLQTRAQMLDEVRAEVDLLSQDLESLASELTPP